MIKRVLPLGIVLLGAGLDFYNLLMVGMRVLAGAAFIIFFLALAFLRTTGFLPEVTVHMTDRFLLGGGDRTFHLGLLLASAGKWLTTGAMAAVGLITEFRALKTGGVRPFALCLASTGIIAVLGLAYASL